MTTPFGPTVLKPNLDTDTTVTKISDSLYGDVFQLTADPADVTLSADSPFTYQTASVLVKRTQANADLTITLNNVWKINAQGQLLLSVTDSQSEVDTGVIIPVDQWHHLTMIEQENSISLFVNGALKLLKTDAGTAAASTTVTMQSTSGGMHFYQVSVFDHVLEDTAVQSNFFGSQPTVKQSFTHVQPIDVKIENSTTSKFSSYPDNKIFIVKVEDASADSGDEASSEKKAEIEQNLHIKNIGQEALEFLVLADSDLNLIPSIDHYHFEFRFRNGVFTGIKDYLSISSEEGWEFSEPTQNTDDNSWSIYGLTKSKKTLEKGGSFNFAFKYRTADAGRGERGTLLNVNYQNITSSSGNNVQGDKNIQIDVLNLAGINLTTPFTPVVYAASSVSHSSELIMSGLAGQVAVNDATNVIFELKNQSKKKIQFDTSRDNHGVEIHIPVGGLASDFVTQANNVAEAISSYLDDSKFGEFSKLSSTDGLAIYRWQPPKPSLSGEVYSAPIEPNSTLLFGLAGIIPNQTQGLVNIKIVLRGVRDLATLAYSVNLMKVTKDIATFVGNDKVGIGTGDSEPTEKLDVSGNIKANKLIDRDNSAFYVDPAGTSILSEIKANRLIDRNNGTYNIDPAGTSTLNSVKANKYSDKANHGFYTIPSGVSVMHQIKADKLIDRKKSDYYVEPSHISYFNQVRATKFYDRDNTSYYMEPAQTSKFNKLDIASLRFTDSTATKASHRDMPMVFKRYSNLGNNVSKKTDFKTDEYNAAVVGMRALNGDISENGAGDIIRAYMYVQNGYWYIRANFLSHVNDENWWIDVMFVRTSMSTREGY